jgi:Vitamin K epoxide reductase family
VIVVSRGFLVEGWPGAALLAGARLHRWYWQGLQAGVIAAAVFIIWLQTQTLYVIGDICLWCLLVWTITIPLVLAVTLHNAAAGHLGAHLRRTGRGPVVPIYPLGRGEVRAPAPHLAGWARVMRLPSVSAS